jgi:hypothetical protein
MPHSSFMQTRTQNGLLRHLKSSKLTLFLVPNCADLEPYPKKNVRSTLNPGKSSEEDRRGREGPRQRCQLGLHSGRTDHAGEDNTFLLGAIVFYISFTKWTLFLDGWKN